MAVNLSLDLPERHLAEVLRLLALHLPGVEAWAYGSRICGNARPASDLDLVVFASPEQSRAVSELIEAFEESSLPFRVDLFVWNEIPEKFQKNISAQHIALYCEK